MELTMNIDEPIEYALRLVGSQQISTNLLGGVRAI